MQFYKTSIFLLLGTMSVSPIVAAQQSSIPNLAKFSAAPTSSVKKFDHSTVRLLTGEFKDGVWQIGVEIKMGPKWKTYWKVPGDAGVPPEFIWKNSSNLANAKVQYPAPHRYEDITGKSIGYKKHVIFPVKLTPIESGKAVKVDLRFYYAVCSDICVPAQANIGMTLPARPVSSASLPAIKAFEALVPKTNEPRLVIQKTEVLQINGKPNLAVSITGKINEKTDVLVEGYEDAFFAAPLAPQIHDNMTVVLLPIEGLEEGAKLSGQKLKLTVLSGDVRLVSDVIVK